MPVSAGRHAGALAEGADEVLHALIADGSGDFRDGHGRVSVRISCYTSEHLIFVQSVRLSQCNDSPLIESRNILPPQS